ncbi:hypothetical protein Vadar_017864 [Vaccinium darrowii]|uniref:Uncharacterized protein n=1 Tax=Vaccinium darrowii TaxID=229202 RepID=A0ACB7XRW2_9ERIC|nr:hypothetical protein Vadar_017864 [Vaccinium darrowii]
MLTYQSYVTLTYRDVALACILAKAFTELDCPWTSNCVPKSRYWCNKLCQFKCCIVNFTGRTVLEALILTSAVAASMTGYVFWAAKKGKNFSYLGPILFTSLFTLVVVGFLQMFFPLGSTSALIYGGIRAVFFS